MKMFYFATKFTVLLFICAFLASCQPEEPQFKIEGLEHVFVIGVDGMSPDGIQNARTPAIDKLWKGGAYTFQARGVLPTSSSPNWASMIMGAGPEQHGITSNDWRKEKHVLPAVTVDETGYFPTIFSIIRKQEPEAEIGAIYHWGGFGRLFSHDHVNFHISPDSEEATASEAIQYIQENKPRFCFIHLDHVDGAGHSKGHGSPEYYRSVEKADSLIGNIIETLEVEQLLDNSLILLTADHGGVGTGHGGEALEEIQIPFILYGKGVKKGYNITGPVNTYDNAVTVAFAIGLDIPLHWIGQPVQEAFEGVSPHDNIKSK